MTQDPKQNQPERSVPSDQAVQADPARRRIDTQIHRRSKAKARPPLQAEWDVASGKRPQGLRMAQDKMDRRSDQA